MSIPRSVPTAARTLAAPVASFSSASADPTHIGGQDRKRELVLKASAGALLCLALAIVPACSGGSDNGGIPPAIDTAEFVRHWSHIAIDASGLDHKPTDSTHNFGEQVGPCRAARAMAIVHVAVFEAVNAIDRKYQSYVGFAPAEPDTSLRAAIAQASCDTLDALFPSQLAIFHGHLADDLAEVEAGGAKDRGIALGHAAAQAILTMRTSDGSELPEPLYGIDYNPSNLNDPGHWRQDPISQHPLALGANWNQVAPFVMTSADQFRAPTPPALNSPEYTLAFNQEVVLGGDGVVTPTLRSEEETFIGTYWAYDGTPSLCAPPRLYNQIAIQIATERGASVTEMARLLALVNIAMADAGIAIWESKYHYAYWRPVTGIREAEPGTGPSGLGDGNAATIGDATFTPLGAPASNLTGPNFTPPFPAYPSGHAGFGGALFQTLRRFYGTDSIEFTFVSDEFNGVTLDNQGNVRPLLPRTFNTLSEAEEENGQSRIYLGIHWVFDKEKGILQGEDVADWVFDHILQPLP